MDKLKKLTKVVLNQQGKVLPKEQMMKILGGGSAYCHCWNSSNAIDASNCSQCQDKCNGLGGVQNCNTVGGYQQKKGLALAEVTSYRQPLVS